MSDIILDRNYLDIEYKDRINEQLNININEKNLNQIVETTFQGLINLLNLDLSENKIEIISNNIFYGLLNLKLINLNNNKIKQINKEVFYQFIENKINYSQTRKSNTFINIW